MGSLALSARQLGRQTGINTLAISAAVLDRFHPAGVLWAGPTHGTRGARDLQAALVRAGISHGHRC